MAGGSVWSRRVAARTRTLRGLVRDTQRALHDVADILHFDSEVFSTVQDVGNHSQRSTALVILGTSPAARARLLHCLLGHQLLPDPPPRGCRWIRIQYGSGAQRQVHLSLGNSEFELVEELECNKRPWDTLPAQDLIRQDKTDLTTILEVEINNQFLKDGLRIILPPDLDVDPGISSIQNLKKTHADLYSKRDSILKNFNPVYLFGVDRIGKNIFSENISGNITTSRSEEDFWNTFNLYSMARVGSSGEVGDSGDGDGDKSEVKRVWNESREPAVFSSENCLDLHQIKEINPNSQVLFVLFSNSEDMNRTEDAEENKRPEKRINVDALKWIFSSRQSQEAQKSTENKAKGEETRLYEEQRAFMTDMMDQWEVMSTPPPKYNVKSQCILLDDSDLLRTADHKSLAPLLATQQLGEGSPRSKDDKVVKSRLTLLSTVVKFAADCLQSYLLEYCTKLSEVHVRLLQRFILASFDLARELQVVPRKIQYVATQEQQLYETINEKFSEGDKKRELLQIMQEVLDEMKAEVNNMDWSVDDLPWHQDPRFIVSNSIFYSSSRSASSPDRVSLRLRTAPDLPSDGEEAVSYDTYNFDDYEIIRANDESYSDSFGKSKPPESSAEESAQYSHIRVENERGELSSLAAAPSLNSCSYSGHLSMKQASLDVQQTVLSKLSQKISLKLAKFVDCLKDTYFGTLQRCLDSLESSCRQELGGRPASEAMRQLLGVARTVDLSPCASFPVLRSLLESLRRILYKLRLVGGGAEEACCVLSPLWRRRVASAALTQLAPHSLARLISTQILERLSMAHEKYQSALTALETALAGRLHHTEDIKLAIRKKYAPTFARLCLESTSMCDLLMYGTPELGREIGRGQYGVVYSVRGSWAGRSPVAVKSVLPADDRHYRELAMEFFYTRSIPAHPRIVRLFGSVVQRHSGAGPCVLLVQERRVRDLHAAVRAGLNFVARIRIARDIVEGIRYLHSLGLVHRDIKMKNVLLDGSDRAALSDLGFCAAEALMSGSVVGTPVHMAPELLAGDYDAAVDVYAFGILFWYVCAGNIKLPSAFETFQNKEQLWSKVKRGLRPERLPHFTDECWEVMESCWASEPSQRALLGDIQTKLEHIHTLALSDTSLQDDGGTPAYDDSDNDSLDMTGIDRT
ncbi:dual serine/threonine and tyrosine protein kinase [Spodoptera frugiperda]|uniref:Dual serine/threonine and tyrosine protein kinase n=1 Tax=Spodoptera frugiperda TaxID=7108 RepID=A0A9R0EY56_SPOFR|nr:dual serine/threonine and tyrosine protein kinase [Spodoptera frugiperda]